MQIVPIGTHTAKIADGPEDRPAKIGFFRKSYEALLSLSTTSTKAWAAWLDNTYTGKHITDQSAMRVATVWGCTRLLVETVGSLPVNVFEVTKSGGKQKTREHPVNARLLQPNRYMTWVEYMEAMQYNLVLLGNSYALDEINGNGDVSSSLPLLATGMQVALLDTGDIEYRYTMPGGKVGFYTDQDITHVKGFGTNGMVGLSPIAYAREMMGAAMSAEEYGARFFANGARPAGIMTMPGFLKPEQRDQARKMFETMHQGTENAHKMAILEGGMTYTAVGLPPEDTQFIEVRKFGINEICRIFRVPPHMVADLDRATFSNIENLSLEFAKYTLRPYLTRYEQRMNMRWIKPADRGRFFLKFNLDGLLRGDTVSRAAFYSQMVQNGIYTRNECRDLEDRNAIAGGDDLTAQVNLAPLASLGQHAQPTQPGLVNGLPVPQAPPPNKADEDRFTKMREILDGFKHPAPPQVNINVPPPVTHVRVESPVINIAPPDVTVNVPPTSVHVDGASVNVAAPKASNGMERIPVRDVNGVITKVIDRPIQ